jgi:hypothetical protein
MVTQSAQTAGLYGGSPPATVKLRAVDLFSMGFTLYTCSSSVEACSFYIVQEAAKSFTKRLKVKKSYHFQIDVCWLDQVDGELEAKGLTVQSHCGYDGERQEAS